MQLTGGKEIIFVKIRIVKNSSELWWAIEMNASYYLELSKRTCLNARRCVVSWLPSDAVPSRPITSFKPAGATSKNKLEFILLKKSISTYVLCLLQAVLTCELQAIP